jgi:hypothetical protein
LQSSSLLSVLNYNFCHPTHALAGLRCCKHQEYSTLVILFKKCCSSIIVFFFWVMITLLFILVVRYRVTSFRTTSIAACVVALLRSGLLWSYLVYFLFLVLPVCCRYFHRFWHLSSWLSILFIFADLHAFACCFLGCFLLGVVLSVGSYFSFYFKKKSTKRKGNFLSIAPLTKK